MRAIVLAGWKRACTVSAVIRLADYFGYDEVVLYNKDKSFVADPYLRTCLATCPEKLPTITQFHELDGFLQHFRRYGDVFVLDTTPASKPYTPDMFRTPNMESYAVVAGHEDRGVPDEIIKRYGAYQIPKQGVMECLSSVSALTIAVWDAERARGDKR